MRFPIILILILFFQLSLNAQSFFPPKKYPKGTYANPVKIPISLAGNFGECRPNHFHSGLDVRTNKVENIPIYNIADGYVSRIKIDEGGFGNAIYFTHKDGYTSLYAHLNKFYPALENYVRFQQYRLKKWDIDIRLLPHELPLKKGTFIAYSGNTGSSQAPHLHMEIRNKEDKPLNGLLFYKYPDTKAPVFTKLAIYNGEQSIYTQKPRLIQCIKKNNVYVPGSELISTSNNVVAFGITADDPMENALGVLGVYEMNMYLDDKPYFGWQLDNIGYDETRYMNAQADYKTKKNGGPWVQLCYKLPQDNLAIYKSFNSLNGRINLQDNKEHSIKIIAKDVNGNANTLQFKIRGTGNNSGTSTKLFYANKDNKYVDNNITFELKKGLLYDDVSMNIGVAKSPNSNRFLYKINTSDVPVHDNFILKLKPQISIPENMLTKVAMVLQPYGTQKNAKGLAANMIDGWASANIKTFGTYEIVLDTKAPVLTCNIAENTKLSKKFIQCTAVEETTSIKKFIGTIDNQWVRFVHKGKYFTYELDSYCPPGKHVLNIAVTDENNNTSTKQINFTN